MWTVILTGESILSSVNVGLIITQLMLNVGLIKPTDMPLQNKEKLKT